MWRRSISLMLVLLLTGCSIEEIPPVRPAALPAKIELLPTRYLPNTVRIHERVISGGLPEGDAAFEELKELGIKTLISVDGVKPDVAQAKKFGMRYVHLPHGYDGV